MFGWFGPLFSYDLTRAARRGHPFILRTAYGLVFLVILSGTWRGLGLTQPADPRVAPRWAVGFFRVLMVAQCFAALVLTPPVVGGAVAEVKQRGTLALLLTTPLTDGQIVRGLCAARLAHLLALVLAGLPVVSCLPLFGGVGMMDVALGYLFTVFTQIVVAAVTLVVAVEAPKLTSTLLRSYGLTLILGGVLVPVYLLLSDDPLVAVGFAVPLGLATAGVLLLAGQRLRPACRAALEQAAVPPPPWPDQRFTAAADRPPVGEHALWWKEAAARPRRGGWTYLLLAMVAVGWAPTFLAGYHTKDREAVVFFNQVALVAGTMGAWWLAALAAAPTVATERSRRTLESLLATPYHPGEILTVKGLSALVGVWPFAGMLGIGGVVAVALSGLHPVGFLLEVLLFLAVLGFAVALGLALSVACRAPDRATQLTAAALLYVTCGGLPLTALVLGEDPDLAMGLTPPRGIALLHATTWERLQLLDRGSGAYLGACLGIPVYGVAALGLWLLAQGRFHRLARNGGG